MKTLIMFLIYIITFMFLFFVLSAIGMLWGNTYHQCISSGEWFAIYALFIGSWSAFLCAREYYWYKREYFDALYD
jgi:uncharacterized membrane protein YdjX (TVP38/TMEM64 family)